MRPGSGQEVFWTSSDRRIIACSSLSTEIRFTRPLVPGVGRSGYADMGRAQRCRPALAQIGEHKYGKPVLDRAINYEMDIYDALKVGLISIDSTLRSNLSVGLPVDLMAVSYTHLTLPTTERV